MPCRHMVKNQVVACSTGQGRGIVNVWSSRSPRFSVNTKQLVLIRVILGAPSTSRFSKGVISIHSNTISSRIIIINTPKLMSSQQWNCIANAQRK